MQCKSSSRVPLGRILRIVVAAAAFALSSKLLLADDLAQPQNKQAKADAQIASALTEIEHELTKSGTSPFDAVATMLFSALALVPTASIEGRRLMTEFPTVLKKHSVEERKIGHSESATHLSIFADAAGSFISESVARASRDNDGQKNRDFQRDSADQAQELRPDGRRGATSNVRVPDALSGSTAAPPLNQDRTGPTGSDAAIDGSEPARQAPEARPLRSSGIIISGGGAAPQAAPVVALLAEKQEQRSQTSPGVTASEAEVARQDQAPHPIAATAPTDDGRILARQPRGIAEPTSPVGLPATKQEQVGQPGLGTPDGTSPAETAMLSSAAPRGVVQTLNMPKTDIVASPPTLPSAVLQILLARGELMLSLGDVSAARLLFARAAESGTAVAALKVGDTYNPDFLTEHSLRGIKPNPAEAEAWYRKASALGEPQAEDRLRKMENRRSEDR
jgi:hypothetical protein